MSMALPFSGDILFDRYRAVERALDVGDYSRRLIHYTSFDVLQKIIEGRELWLGELGEMNDPSECDHFIEGLTLGLNRVRLPPAVQALVPVLTDYSPAMKSGTFISSWCEYFETKPSGSRGMWVEYGKLGQGIGIVIDSSGFVASSLNSRKIRFAINASKMKYLPRENVAQEVSDLIGRLNRIGMFNDGVEAALSVIMLLLAKASSIKHEEYAPENEIRFLYLDYLRKLMPGALPDAASSFEPFRDSSTGRRFIRLPLRNYADQDIDLSPEKILRKIVVGSSQSSEVSAGRVSELLRANGLGHVEVLVSDIPMK